MVDHPAEPANSAVSAHQRRFEVQECWSDRLVVLSASDAVDMLSAPQLTKAICDALRNASVGMSVLVAAQEAADAMSVRFGIVADGAATSRPIRLLGIDAILVIYPTLSDALRDLRCTNDEPAPTQSL